MLCSSLFTVLSVPSRRTRDQYSCLLLLHLLSRLSSTTMEYDNRNGVAELRHRRSMPDVPSDIDDESLMEHFNDPNYDFDAQSYSSTYFTDRETGTKGFSEKRSSFVATTDMETESQISSSWRAGSTKGDLAGDEYEECVVVLYLSFYAPQLRSVIRPILKFAPRCPMLTTPRCPQAQSGREYIAFTVITRLIARLAGLSASLSL